MEMVRIVVDPSVTGGLYRVIMYGALVVYRVVSLTVCLIGKPDPFLRGDQIDHGGGMSLWIEWTS